MNKESLIISYFENNLTDKEKLFFDQLMKTDKSFADAVRFEEKTKIALTIEARDELKSRLQSYEAQRKQKSRLQKWLYVAASIVILLGISMFVFNQQSSPSQLSAAYFKPYPNTVAPIVRGDENNLDNQKAFVAYESGNYDEALGMFEKLTKNTQEDYAFFYQAMSLMGSEKYDAAQEVLTSRTWSEEYRDKANWYLALNLLHLNQVNDSRSILEEIVRSQSYNHKLAAELLKKLS